MGKVLIDGWTLLSVLQQITKPINYDLDEKSKLCMCYLTTSIILWDELIYPIGGTFPEKINFSDDKLGNVLKGVFSHKFHDLNFNPFFDSLETLYAKRSWKGLPAKFGLERSKIYLKVSQEWEMNYFPHPLRAQYIDKHNLCVLDFERIKVIENLDSKLKDYYNEINRIYGKNILHVKYPLLYDYIRKNCNNPLDEINAALELRNEKDVILFRDSLNQLEDILNSGNIRDFGLVLKQIGELSNNIINKHKGATTPIITIGLSGPSVTFPEKKLTKKIINMTFLTKLADFAQTKRLDSSYRKK